MAGAGEGDESRLRIGRYVTDPVEASPEPATMPTVSTSTNAPTQLLPVVNPQPAIVDVPTIRARARRPATALPALGSDAPAPARAADAHRRRRAANPAEAGAEAGPRTPSDTATPATVMPATVTPATGPVAPATAPVVVAPVVVGAVAEAALAEPEPEVVKPVRRTRHAAHDADAFGTPPPSRPAEPPAVPTAPTVPAAPIAPAAAPVSPAVAGPVLPVEVTPLAPESVSAEVAALEADTGELPIVEAAPAGAPPPRHAAANAAETAILEAILPDAPPEPVSPDAGVVADEWDAPADPGADEDGRPGPAPIDEDNWDSEPETTGEVDTYQGRRRAEVGSKRLWLVLAAVVVALSAAIGVPLALTSSPAADPTAVGTPPSFGGNPDTQAPPPTGELISAASSIGPSASKPPTSKAPASAAPTTPNPTTIPPVAFAPVTVQAETAALSGDVKVDANPSCYPGGPSVVQLGSRWGGTGMITFTAAVPTAGQYVVTVHYVITFDPSRRAQISVINGATQTVTFLNTESPPTCVDAQPGIAVTLVAGNNQIRISNPDRRGPTIDKIVITRP